ncbi:MAG: OsmC family protein [Chloroflexota bacterium]
MSSSLQFSGGMAFDVVTGTDHKLRIDSSPEVGGNDDAARPMELLLIGLGGCTGMDVVSILRKMRQPLTSYEINVSGERANEHPRVFTSILVEHIFHGQDLSETAIRKAVKLSEERYCPANAMLGAVAAIEHRIRIVHESVVTSEQPVP